MADRRVAVEFTGTVLTEGTGVSGMSRVGDDDGFIHYLYLDTDRARREVLAKPDAYGGAPLPGRRIAVRFTGTASEEPGPGGNTQVISDVISDGERGYYHYLNLDSPAVKFLEEATSAGTYELDDLVTVNFTGTVLSGSDKLSITAAVQEAGNGKIHYLFLSSGIFGKGARPAVGETVTVSFEAKVRSSRGVREADGRRGVVDTTEGRYYHYLDMSSPSVRRKQDGTSLSRPSVREQNGLVGLLARSQRITGDQVRALIEERELLTWAARRVRDGEVLKQGFDDIAEAEAWIADNDYLPGTVEACQIEEGEPSEELAALRRLDELAAEAVADWADAGFVIPADAITEDYARQLAAEDYSYLDLDEWPFSYIDWRAAADALLERAEKFEWGGRLWAAG